VEKLGALEDLVDTRATDTALKSHSAGNGVTGEQLIDPRDYTNGDNDVNGSDRAPAVCDRPGAVLRTGYGHISLQPVRRLLFSPLYYR
jgi:hypothetical protein